MIPRSFQHDSGVIAESFWDYSGVIPSHSRIIPESFWDHSGVIVGSFWDHSGSILGSFQGHSGIIPGSFRDYAHLSYSDDYSHRNNNAVDYFYYSCDYSYSINRYGCNILHWKGTPAPPVYPTPHLGKLDGSTGAKFTGPVSGFPVRLSATSAQFPVPVSSFPASW